MCTKIQNSPENQNLAPLAAPQADQRVANLMQQIIEQKQIAINTSKNNRLNASEVIMIGGDLFAMGYLTFQGAQMIKPALSSIPAIAMATLTCGVIAGTINIGVALICLKEGIQAYENGDKKLAARLILDFFCYMGIGAIMILAALAIRVTALAGITAFFAANPWFLPVLFFVVSIPIILEIGARIQNIQTSKDLASQVTDETLQTLIHGNDTNNPYHLQNLINEVGSTDASIKERLSKKMEQFQADMGVEAAVETFKLMRQLLLGEEVSEQRVQLKEKVKEWNRAQYVRLAQQILYTAAFGVSMAALSPKANATALNASQTFAMAGGNAIPFYMDTFWPFKRNTPIVVPIVH